MFNIKKSYPAPLSLSKEKIKEYGTYRTEEVLEMLKKDFFNKCYICEYKKPTTLNVEHFVSHKGDIELKFNWDNLFLACSHCNNIKGTKYDNIILSPISENENVETFIHYEMPTFPKSKVKLEVLKNTEKTKNTVKLLNEVYNGTTPLKSIESEYIRENILKELIDIQTSLINYYDDDSDEYDRSAAKKNIINHLNRNSAFTAFKRWIIRDNDVFYKDFKEFID
ncbi:HNH endonuclease [Clostridium butyricum]|uniref:HNH domain-containing protein n=1 Tax=Clostridium butyricum TaxID=1492 RepID=A0A2S7FBR7_CLOBU|nr:HNH endonuclease [Clostridium butyricum]PPV15430.1 hypothetical protein AWN73_11665 [Clostridium butyricum]